jgi:hypothetical protein
LIGLPVADLRSKGRPRRAAPTRPSQFEPDTTRNQPEASAGVEALEWVLVTDLEAGSFAQGCEVAQMYATRWLIEEFHKALKTGMGVERLQLTTAPAWFAATPLMSITALRLIRVRENVWRAPAAPAESSDLSELELKVLRARSGKPLLTVEEVALHWVA